MAAAISSAIRPTGLVFVLVGLVVLGQSIRKRQSFAPALLVVLAPLGAVSYYIFLWRHTGHLDAWWIAERQGWGVHEDFGKAAAKFVGKSIFAPGAHPWFDVVTIVMAVAAVLSLALIQMRLPVPLIVYVLGVLAVALTSGIGTVGSFPRAAFTAFPLVIPIARFLDRLPVSARLVSGAVSFGLGCVLGVIVTTTHLVTP